MEDEAGRKEKRMENGDVRGPPERAEQCRANPRTRATQGAPINVGVLIHMMENGLGTLSRTAWVEIRST
eukprot:7563127-Pyramimonas_sp.AAC.1